MRRQSDTTSGPIYRGGRYFKLHDYWFFATREGATVGPYDTREGAVQGTNDYIQFIQQAPASVMKVLHREDRLIA